MYTPRRPAPISCAHCGDVICPNIEKSSMCCICLKEPDSNQCLNCRYRQDKSVILPSARMQYEYDRLEEEVMKKQDYDRRLEAYLREIEPRPKYVYTPPPFTPYCPNCVPDYLNGFIPKSPELTNLPYRDCKHCGLSYPVGEREKAMRMWLERNGEDHLSDYLAVYIAEQGQAGIIKALELAASWQRKEGFTKRVQSMIHTAGLAWMARYCEWPKEPFHSRLKELGLR